MPPTKVDHSNTICCICKSKKTYVEVGTGRPVWHKCICGKKDCTGYSCDKCINKVKYRSLDRNYIALWRIGELGPNSTNGKGFIGQQIISRTYEVDDCNLKMDNFRFYVDLSKISGYGYCEVKIATVSYGVYHFNTKRHQDYDNIFLICMDEQWTNVERVYVIPWEYAVKRTSIGIIKNPSKKTWYAEFRIDEKLFNDTYHKMKLENCKYLKSDNVL